MNKNEREAMREKRVKDYAGHLMQEGEAFFPFTAKNFTEALQNLRDDEYRMLAVSASVRAKTPNNGIVERKLMRMATEYWARIAMAEAERTIPSVEEFTKEK